jgi:hypothetical protein
MDSQELDQGRNSRPAVTSRANSASADDPRIELARRWSVFVAEQVVGWGGIALGAVAIMAPRVFTSQMILNHPIELIAVGFGVLGGRKLLSLLKNIIGAA